MAHPYGQLWDQKTHLTAIEASDQIVASIFKHIVIY